MNRESVIAALVEHHSSQEYHPEDYYGCVVNADGKYLGPYIPYIGKLYFETKSRLLIYAMAQNLNCAKQLIKSWLNGPDKGMLRQYRDIPHVHVHPYDSGHLKVIAALALNAYPMGGHKPSNNIDDLVAITNFVKFSFYHEDEKGNRLDANPPLDIYAVMWEKYSKYEVDLLQPNIIIGVGNDVTRALNRCLEGDKKHIIIRVPFPGRLNLNARWIPKGRQLVKTKDYDPATDKAEMHALLSGTPDKRKAIHRAIETDWYYFREMKAFLSEKLARCV